MGEQLNAGLGSGTLIILHRWSVGSLVTSSSVSHFLFLSFSQTVPQRDMELELEMPMEMGGEQGRWEEERLKTASLSFGAKRERERGMKEEKEKYQLILEEDEMINFVSSAVTMKGTLSEMVFLLSFIKCLQFYERNRIPCYDQNIFTYCQMQLITSK